MSESDQLERFCQQFDIERSDPLIMAVALAEKLGEQVNKLAAVVQDQKREIGELCQLLCLANERSRILDAMLQ